MHFSLFYDRKFHHMFVFDKTHCLPFLDGKSFDSTVFADQGKNRYRSPPSRIALCVLGMHLHSFEIAGKHLFVHWDLGSGVQKQSFPP